MWIRNNLRLIKQEDATCKENAVYKENNKKGMKEKMKKKAKLRTNLC